MSINLLTIEYSSPFIFSGIVMKWIGGGIEYALADESDTVIGLLIDLVHLPAFDLRRYKEIFLCKFCKIFYNRF